MQKNIIKNNPELEKLKEEYKETIKKLEEIEEKFQSFPDSAYRFIFIADENKNLTFVNQTMCNALGYKKEEMPQINLTQIFDKESFEDIFSTGENKELKGIRRINKNVNLLTKDGHKIFGKIKITELLGFNDNFIGSRAIFHKLSGGTKYENLLLQSKERYRTLVENLPVGIGIISEDGKIVSANNLALETTGYELKDLEWLTILHLYSNSDDKDIILEKIKNIELIRNCEIQANRKDGSPIKLLVNVKPIRYSDGKYLLIVFNDITERKITDKKVQAS